MFQHAGEESIGESTMVKNVELAKEMGEKKEKHRLFEEALKEMKLTVKEVADAAKKKEGEWSKDKGKVIEEEDVITKPDGTLNEEPFLKAIKPLRGKALEGVPLFSGKMDIDAVMDWVDGMENHFDYEGVKKA